MHVLPYIARSKYPLRRRNKYVVALYYLQLRSHESIREQKDRRRTMISSIGATEIASSMGAREIAPA